MEEQRMLIHACRDRKKHAYIEEVLIHRCVVVLKRLNGNTRRHIDTLLKRNSDIHDRNTRYSNVNLVCPFFKKSSSLLKVVELLQLGQLEIGTIWTYNLNKSIVLRFLNANFLNIFWKTELYIFKV